MISKIYYSLVAILILVTLVACELFNEGFGDKVDLKGPTVNIEGQNGLYEKGTYTLTGKAEDDTKVSSVKVEFLDINDTKRVMPAKINGIEWSIDLDTTDKNLFKDGEIEFKVIVSDDSGKTSTQTKFIFIDNTKPTVLITSPDLYDKELASVTPPKQLFNQQFTVKGEVSDVKIDEVTAYLVSKDDGKKYSGTVVGTASWNCTFDTEALGIPKAQYSLVVEAKDKAGNTNDYFYHFSDTWLSGKQYTVDDLVKEADDSNPAIVNIRKTGNTTSDSILLSVDPDSDAPVLRVINKDEWSQIDSNIFNPGDEVSLSATISDDDGINRVVVTVTDVHSGSILKVAEYEPAELLKNKTLSIPLALDSWGTEWTKSSTWNATDSIGSYKVEVEIEDINTPVPTTESIDYNYSINQGPPSIKNIVITGLNSDGYVVTDQDFKITGVAEDTDTIKTVSLIFTNKDGVELTPHIIKNFSTTSVNFEFTESDIVELANFLNVEREKYSIEIKAVDGNDAPNSLSEIVQIDTKPPVPVIVLPGESSPTDEPTVNGKINIRLSGSDNSNIINGAELFYSVDSGSSWISVATDSNGYAWDYDLDTTIINSTYNSTTVTKLKLEVIDVAGNVGSIIRTITVDQSGDVPVFTLTNVDTAYKTPADAVNNEVINETFISGVLEDDDNIDKDSVRIRVSTQSTVGTWAPISDLRAETISKYNWSHDISAFDNGVYYIELEAADQSGVKYTSASAECYFTFDKDSPSVRVTNLNENDFIPATFTVSVEASDNSGIKAVNIKVNDKTPVTAIYNSGTGEWINNSLTADSEGNVVIIVSAVDNFDKETFTEKLIVVYDQSEPEKLLVDPLPKVGGVDNVISGEYLFTGEASDSGSNIKIVQYEIDESGSWSDVLGRTSWSINIDTEHGVNGLTSGTHNIRFRAEDKAGNIKTGNLIEFIVDQNTPVLVESNSSTRTGNGSYKINGTISDDYDIETLTVNGNAVTISGSPAGGSVANWEYPGLETEKIHNYEIIATDKGGRTTTVNRTVLFDKSGPGVTIEELASLTGNLYTIKGKGVEPNAGVVDVSGVDKVYYKIKDKSEPAEPNNSDIAGWVVADGTGSWSHDIDPVSYGEGEKSLYVKAVDAAGNFGSVAREDFYVDENPPTITITDEPVNYTNSGFTIKGTVSDSQGFGTDPVSIKIGDAVPVSVAIDGSNIWDFTGILPSGTDKAFTIKIWVNDIAGRPSAEVIRSITLDTKEPTVSEPIVTPVVDTNTVNEKVDFSVVAIDENVFDRVKYWVVKSSDINPITWDSAGGIELSTAPFEDEIDTEVLDNEEYKIYVIGRDKAGNKKHNFTLIDVDQSSDIPKLSVTNLNSHSGSGKNYFLGQVVSISVSDDDIVMADSIEVSVTDASASSAGTWINLGINSVNNGRSVSGEYTIPNSGIGIKGDKKLWIRAKDKNLIDPFHELTTPIEFTIDRENPKIINYEVKDNNGKSSYVNIDSISLNVIAEITDDTELASSSPISLTYKKGGVPQPAIITFSKSGNIYTSAALPKDSFDDGETELTLTVADQFGKPATQKLSVYKDIAKPVLLNNEQYPETDTVGNGIILVSGKTTDDSSTDSGIESVKIKLTKNSDELTGIYSGADNSWSYALDLNDLVVLSNSTPILLDDIPGLTTGIDIITYPTPVEGKYYKATDNKYYLYNGTEYIEVLEIRKLPLEIQSYDKAGNSSAVVTRDIYIDPKTDLPVLSLDNITLESDKWVFPGQLIKGTITDDDEVDASTIEFAVTASGVAPTVWAKPISPVDGKSVKWNYTIPDSDTGTVKGTAGVRDLHIRALDVNGISHSLKKEFVIDRVEPVITNFKAVDDNGKTSINKLSSTLTLSATVTDDTEIAAIDGVVVSVGGSPVTLSNGGSGSDYSFTLNNSTVTAISEGTISLTITAKDQFGKQKVETISLLKDATDPTISFIDPRITTDKNGKILISGTTTDANLNNIKLYYVADPIPATLLSGDLEASLTIGGAATGTTGQFETGSSVYSWSKIIDTRDILSTGSKHIVLVAADASGNSIQDSIKIDIDQSKDNPSITEDSNMQEYGIPALNTYALDHNSGNNVIFGVTQDSNILDASRISVKINSEVTDRSPVILSGDGTRSVSWYLDLSDLNPDTSAVVICHYDGSMTGPEHYLGIRGASVSTGQVVNKFSASDRLSGYALDDDMINAGSINVKVNGTDNIKSGVNSDRVRWEHDFRVIDSGLYYVEISASDIKDSGFETDIKNVDLKTLIVKDHEAPVIDAKLKGEDGVEIPHQGAYVKDDVSAFGTASDDLSIKDFTITVKSTGSPDEILSIHNDPSTTSAFDVKANEFGPSAPDQKTWEWDFKLDRLPDAYKDEIITVVYSATDTVGNVTREENVVTVDTEAPTITPLNPLSGDTVNGKVVLRGTADDAALNEIDVSIGLYRDKLEGEGNTIPESDWNNLPNAVSGNYNWSVDLDDIVNYIDKDRYVYENGFILDPKTYLNKSAIEADTGYLTDWNVEKRIYKITSRPEHYYKYDGGVVTKYDPLWDMYIFLRATDRAGNITYKKHMISIDAAGDRPTVSILTPSMDAKVGGAVNVMGTAKDDDAVYKVKMQISADGDMDFTETHNYIVPIDGKTAFDENTIYELNGTLNWDMKINELGELYPDASNVTDYGKIVLKVWAEDTKDGSSADISSNPVYVNFTMDNTIPIIEDVYLGAEEYKGGHSVKGVVDITARLKDKSIGVNNKITSISAKTNGISWEEITEADGLGGIRLLSSFVTQYPGSTLTPVVESGFDSYDILWKYNTSSDENNRPKSLGIKVEDGQFYHIQNLDFNVDNLAPAMYTTPTLETPYKDGWNIVATDSNDICNSEDILEPYYWIQGKSVDAAGLDRVDIYFVREETPGAFTLCKFDKTSPEWDWMSISDNTLATLEANNTYAVSINDKAEAYNDATSGDDDGFKESLEDTIGEVRWGVKLDTSKIKNDGNVVIHYIAYDKSGNAVGTSKAGIVMNNKPDISSIEIGYNLAPGVDKVYPYTYDEAESHEIIGKLLVNVVASPKAGSTISKIEIFSSSDTNETTPLDSATGNTLNGEITYSTPGLYTYIVKVTDSNNTIRRSKINTNRVSSDTESPLVSLYPFKRQYLIDTEGHLSTTGNTIEAVNSDNQVVFTLDDGGVVQGHIELIGDSRNSDGSVEANNDADVSGKVMLKGFVSENSSIEKLELVIDGTVTGTTDKDIYGLKTNMDLADLKIYVDKNGNHKMDTGEEGVKNDETGMSFYWEYYWNSNSDISTDKSIEIRATDFAGKTNDSSGSTSFEKGEMTVDIVPYVTEIITSLFLRNTSLTRTALGYYPVSEEETIRIKGFNLGNKVTVDGVELTSVVLNGDKTEVTANIDDNTTAGDDNAIKTGKVIVTAGVVQSINNSNKNSDYNVQPTVNNDSLTDDISLDVYEIKGVAEALNKKLLDPHMKLSPTDSVGPQGAIGFSFGNGSSHFNMPGKPNNISDVYSQTPFDMGWDIFPSNNFTWDSKGNTFGLASCEDRNFDYPGALALYVNEAGRRVDEQHPWDAFGDPNYSGDGVNAADLGMNKNRIEQEKVQLKTGGPVILDGNRFISPELATSVESDTTHIYSVYYDVVAQQMRYRYGTYDNTITATETYHTGLSTPSLKDVGATRGNSITGNADSAESDIQVIASNGIPGGKARYSSSSTYKPGEFLSIGVTKKISGITDTVIVTWLDTSTNTLIISYNESPQSLTGTWVSRELMGATGGGGSYVNMAIDSDGGLHIVYQTSTNELRYVFLSDYKAVPEVAIIDKIGSNCTIDVAFDGSNQIPYISYYTSGIAPLKVAYRNNFTSIKDAIRYDGNANAVYTGHWEVTSLPTVNVPSMNRVSIGLGKKLDGTLAPIPSGDSTSFSGTPTGSASESICDSTRIFGNNTKNPVIGYLASRSKILEMVQKK